METTADTESASDVQERVGKALERQEASSLQVKPAPSLSPASSDESLTETETELEMGSSKAFSGASIVTTGLELPAGQAVSEPASGSFIRTFGLASEEEDQKLLDTINSILEEEIESTGEASASDFEFSSSSDDSDGDSDSDYESGSPTVVDLQVLEKRLIAADTSEEANAGIVPPKTKNEQTELPPAPDISEIVIPESASLYPIGKVESMLGDLVVVHVPSIVDKVLDIDTILVRNDRTPIGRIFEVLGPVVKPVYTVRVKSGEGESGQKNELIGMEVYAVSGLDEFVKTDMLRTIKGSDASNMFDEEVKETEREFSDDEEEMEWKKSQRRAKKENQNDGVEQFERRNHQTQQQYPHHDTPQQQYQQQQKRLPERQQQYQHHQQQRLPERQQQYQNQQKHSSEHQYQHHQQQHFPERRQQNQQHNFPERQYQHQPSQHLGGDSEALSKEEGASDEYEPLKRPDSGFALPGARMPRESRKRERYSAGSGGGDGRSGARLESREDKPYRIPKRQPADAQPWSGPSGGDQQNQFSMAFQQQAAALSMQYQMMMMAGMQQPGGQPAGMNAPMMNPGMMNPAMMNPAMAAQMMNPAMMNPALSAQMMNPAMAMAFMMQPPAPPPTQSQSRHVNPRFQRYSRGRGRN